MPSLNWQEKVTGFMEISVDCKKNLENLSYKFIVIISFALLRSSYFIFSHSFQIFLFLKVFIEMLSLNRHEKVTLTWNFPQMVKKQLKNNSYRIVVIISFALLRSSYFNFLRPFQIFLFLKTFIEMPSLNRHEKVTGFLEFSANGKKTT